MIPLTALLTHYNTDSYWAWTMSSLRHNTADRYRKHTDLQKLKTIQILTVFTLEGSTVMESSSLD